MAKPSVSFCMIVRNGGATLSACLESVAPLVDEMVVVDTGSTDDSIDVARARSARVISVPWRDDFAAARNIYVDAARCSWILSLDADEAIAPIDATELRMVLSRHPRSVFVFTIRNYFLLKDWQGPMAPSDFGGEIEPGIGWTPSRTVRLFPRRHGLAYRYPVHESLLPSATAQGLSIKPCAISIHHIGMLQSAADRSPKRTMYRRLGQKKLAQYPRYFLSYLELGQVYLAEGDLGQAERLFAQCLRLNPFCSRAYYFFIMAALRAGRHAQARQRAERALRLLPRDRDLLYARGLAELELGNAPAAAASLAPALRQMPRPADGIGALRSSPAPDAACR